MNHKQRDAINIRILHELQENARLTNAELATRGHLSPSPCLARVRALIAAAGLGTDIVPVGSDKRQRSSSSKQR